MLTRIGHSPDPDDAFMVWALHEGLVASDEFRIELVPEDIQSLNERALGTDPLEVTALSLGAFPRVAKRYALFTHGASFAEGTGPLVISREPSGVQDLQHVTVAVPGELTTAFAVLRLAVGEVTYDVVPFDEILPRVKDGEFDAGVLIHEGQITYAREGVHKVVDLAEWWAGETGLPLPLGVNAVRRDLDEETLRRLSALVAESIQVGLKQRPQALEYARKFGRGIGLEDTARFVEMYVSPMTVDMGERGRHAILEFLSRTSAAGILPATEPPRFVR